MGAIADLGTFVVAVVASQLDEPKSLRRSQVAQAAIMVVRRLAPILGAADAKRWRER